jgi:predicted small secreted protein
VERVSCRGTEAWSYKEVSFFSNEFSMSKKITGSFLWTIHKLLKEEKKAHSVLVIGIRHTRQKDSSFKFN